MRKTSFLLCLFVLPFMLTGCHEDEFREGVVVAGGRYVSADILNEGKRTYMEYCFACHGIEGDGNGVAAKGLYPPPRNFKQGLIKFGTVEAGGLATDEDWKRIIKHGLNGTAMLPWDIRQERLDAVIQYIKTFAPDVWIGKDKKLGTPAKIYPNPYGLAHKSAAIQKGKEIYHVVAQCFSCHRAYESKESIVEMSKKYPDYAMTMDDLDDEMYKLKNQESDYEVKFLPPDFTWHEIRSAQSVEEIYTRLVVGVNGTSMPAWRETITEEEIWAVAHYVKHLMDMKDTPARGELLSEIED